MTEQITQEMIDSAHELAGVIRDVIESLHLIATCPKTLCKVCDKNRELADITLQVFHKRLLEYVASTKTNTLN